jgi:hypothetical protein
LRLTRRTFFLPAGRSEGLGPVPLTLLPFVFPAAFLLEGQGNGICRMVWAPAKVVAFGLPLLATSTAKAGGSQLQVPGT